jgi:hypothetical protein
LPFGPHYGSHITLNARPRSIQGNVQVIPRALPMDQFKVAWKHLPDSQHNFLWKSSVCKAHRVLSKQKLSSGIAIRGKPPKVLDNDCKFQGELKATSISNGEQLALSMLASEILVLSTVGIPSSSHHKYTGRAQFPQFKTKPIIQKNIVDYDPQCHHLLFWGEVRSTMRFLFKGNLGGDAPNIVAALLQLLVFVPDHTADLSIELQVDASVIRNMLPYSSSDQYKYDTDSMRTLLGTADKIHTSYANKISSATTCAWRTHAKYQLHKGGGTMFKFVSKKDKEF